MASPCRLVLLLALCPTPGCNATLAFQDEFTADRLGELPNVDPPGEPAGDRLYYTIGAGAPEGMLEVVDDPVLGSRALRINDASSGGIPFKRLAFAGVPITPADSNRFRVSWRGVIDVHPDGAPVVFWVTNQDSHVIALIQFTMDGELLRHTTAPWIEGPLEVVGSIAEGRPHTVVWTFDRPSGQQQIVAYRYGPANGSLLPTLDTGWVDVIDAEPLMDDEFILNHWYGSGLGSPSSYVIDSVRISTRE